MLVPCCHSSWSPEGNPFLCKPCLGVRQGWPPAGRLTSQSLSVHSREFFYEMLLKKKKLFRCFKSQLQHMGSPLFIVAGELLAAPCGIYFPDQRWILGTLHGERRVLATGSAGKSLKCIRWNADPGHTEKDAQGAQPRRQGVHSGEKAPGLCSWDVRSPPPKARGSISVFAPGASHTLICTRITWGTSGMQILIQKVQDGA